MSKRKKGMETPKKRRIRKPKPERRIARANKRIVVAEKGYICEYEGGCDCTDRTLIQLHHKDCNRFNNDFSNYQLLCDYHHKKVHGFI